MIITKSDGTRWANNCSLCQTTHRLAVPNVSYGHQPECPWCRSVREMHGDYFYPITDSNRHLFGPPKPTPESQLQPTIADVRRVVREELVAKTQEGART